MQKYADRESWSKQHGIRTLEVQMQQQMKLFRSQRNFYIVGFTLFLCLVNKRLLELILENSTMEEEVFDKNEGQNFAFIKGKFEEIKTTADIFKKENIIFEEKCSQLKLEIKRLNQLQEAKK